MNAPTSFKLNTANARQVGASISIEEKGAYRGVFTRAEMVTSKKHTLGVEFDFKSEDGASAKYMTIWYQNSEGVELSGRKIIDAIMTCVGVREISAANARIKVWDGATRSEVEKKAQVLMNLMNVPVGVVLAREEYEANDGTRKWKNMLVCPYEAKTNRTAGERLDNKTEPLDLDRILRNLRDKPLKITSMPSRQAPAQHGDFGDFGGPIDDEMDF